MMNNNDKTLGFRVFAVAARPVICKMQRNLRNDSTEFAFLQSIRSTAAQSIEFGLANIGGKRSA